MPEQEDVEDKGGTMRLGAYPCRVAPGTLGVRGLRRGGRLRAPSPPLRGRTTPSATRLSGGGPRGVAACLPNGRLTEMVELPDHPWYRGRARAIPSSRAARRALIRCSWDSSALPSPDEDEEMPSHRRSRMMKGRSLAGRVKDGSLGSPLADSLSNGGQFRKRPGSKSHSFGRCEAFLRSAGRLERLEQRPGRVVRPGDARAVRRRVSQQGFTAAKTVTWNDPKAEEPSTQATA